MYDRDLETMPARLLTNRELDYEVERLGKIWPRDNPREEEVEQEMVRRG